MLTEKSICFICFNIQYNLWKQQTVWSRGLNVSSLKLRTKILHLSQLYVSFFSKNYKYINLLQPIIVQCCYKMSYYSLRWECQWHNIMWLLNQYRANIYSTPIYTILNGSAEVRITFVVPQDCLSSISNYCASQQWRTNINCYRKIV